jgi:hypothetical protein
MLPDSAKASETQKTLNSTNAKDLQLPLEARAQIQVKKSWKAQVLRQE